jgi:hypothetical protein
MKHFGENTTMYIVQSWSKLLPPPPPPTIPMPESRMKKMKMAPPTHPELFILLAMRRLASRGASPDAGRNYEELGKIILQNLESCTLKNARILADFLGKNTRMKINATLRIIIALFCNFVLISQVIAQKISSYTEMEFLDISLTKDSSLLLHAIHSPFYWRILKNTILFSGFKNPYKKSQNKKTRVYMYS